MFYGSAVLVNSTRYALIYGSSGTSYASNYCATFASIAESASAFSSGSFESSGGIADLRTRAVTNNAPLYMKNQSANHTGGTGSTFVVEVVYDIISF